MASYASNACSQKEQKMNSSSQHKKNPTPCNKGGNANIPFLLYMDPWDRD